MNHPVAVTIYRAHYSALVRGGRRAHLRRSHPKVAHSVRSDAKARFYQLELAPPLALWPALQCAVKVAGAGGGGVRSDCTQPLDLSDACQVIDVNLNFGSSDSVSGFCASDAY